jgi:folate-binding protein YgfZ
MRTPLYELQKSMGARFGDYQGWELPERYLEPVVETGSVRRGAAMFDLSHRLSLQAVGKDRVRFLHGMLTNDILSLGPGDGCHAAMLTPKGRIRTDLRVYAGGDRLRLEVEAELREVLKAALDKFIIADDVRILDDTDRSGLLLVQGPAAAERMRPMLLGHLPADGHRWVETEWNGIPLVITHRADCTGETGFELRLAGSGLGTVWKHLLQLGIDPAGMTALEILRVEAGRPRAGTDLDESILAPEAPLEDAIHHDKGCYIGQEVVARVRDRGHVNRRFTGFRILTGAIPARGDAVLVDGKEVGLVTSAVFSPALAAPIALGYIRAEYAEPETRLQIRNGKELLPAATSTLPFSVPNPGRSDFSRRCQD